MRSASASIRRGPVLCAAVLVMLSLRCGGDGATKGDASAPSGSGSSGEGASSGSGPSNGSGSSGVDPVDGTGADASVDLDGWASPDVGSPVTPGSPGQVDLTFTIHANEGARSISPYIYGVNNGAQATAHHASIVRVGGNRMTAYNWENNASNAGSDYEFQNDDFLCSGVTCTPNDNTPGAYLKYIVDQASAAGAATLVTVPIVDYVAADKSPGGDVRNSGSNYLQTRFKQNKVKGSGWSNPPDTTDAFVYQDEMVNWLSQTEPHATLRYLLDNEPDLWSSTHAEVHPTPVTYAEIAQRSIEYAKAVKAVVPTAHVSGLASYGWAGYVSLQSATDSKADGDFLSWWLGQMKAAATSWGKPVVDGMDLHWYAEAGDDGAQTSTNGGPQGSDCRITNDTTTDKSMASDCYTTAGIAGTVAAREQATRSLWDSTYVENSWIATSLKGKAIELVPLVQQKIAANDPAMTLSFSEWNYGGGSDISGTIATADALGIFGAYGVDMAMLWEVWHSESFTYAAFDAYRDYDGNGAAFGDTSIAASTSDVPDSSVYASLASADPSRLVVIAINKAMSSKVAGIVINHSTVYTKADVYAVTQTGGAKVVQGAGLTAVATNAFQYTMPAQSVSVIVPAP